MPFLLEGTNELVLSVPDLGIDDVALIISHARYSGWEFWPTERGRMVYELGGIQAGVITFAGTYQTVSETQARYTYQMAGNFTGGPLAGASLLAIERFEENLDGNSNALTSAGTVEDVLIVPFYTDFPPFKDMESLPPLKPVTELPSGIGWRICEMEEATR